MNALAFAAFSVVQPFDAFALLVLWRVASQEQLIGFVHVLVIVFPVQFRPIFVFQGLVVQHIDAVAACAAVVDDVAAVAAVAAVVAVAARAVVVVVDDAPGAVAYAVAELSFDGHYFRMFVSFVSD